MLTVSADSSSFFARFQAAASGRRASQKGQRMTSNDFTNRRQGFDKSARALGHSGWQIRILHGHAFRFGVHTQTGRRFPAAKNRIAVFTPSIRGNEGKWALVPQGVRVPVLYLAQRSHDLRDFRGSGCSPCHCVASARGFHPGPTVTIRGTKQDSDFFLHPAARSAAGQK